MILSLLYPGQARIHPAWEISHSFRLCRSRDLNKRARDGARGLAEACRGAWGPVSLYELLSGVPKPRRRVLEAFSPYL
jgi:hypothetical protein